MPRARNSRPPGRPLALTPEVQAKICTALARGETSAAACAYAGIHVSTFMDWRARANEGPPFSDFCDATTQSKNQGSRVLEEVILNAAVGKEDWRAALELLRLRDPDNYAKRTEVTGASGGPIQIEDIRSQVRAELATTGSADLGIPADVLPDGAA